RDPALDLGLEILLHRSELAVEALQQAVVDAPEPLARARREILGRSQALGLGQRGREPARGTFAGLVQRLERIGRGLRSTRMRAALVLLPAEPAGAGEQQHADGDRREQARARQRPARERIEPALLDLRRAALAQALE